MEEEPEAPQNRWSMVGREGSSHYNLFSTQGSDNGIAFLREFFPDGEADELNFVLFSTGGTHGQYFTIEDIEASLARYPEPPEPDDEGGTPDDWYGDKLTFLCLQPRQVALTYGNARVTLADIPYLKKLRESSWKVMQGIGRPSVRGT